MDFGALRQHLPAFTVGLLIATTRPQPVPVVASTACEYFCDCTGISRGAAAALVLLGALLLLVGQLAWAGSSALLARLRAASELLPQPLTAPLRPEAGATGLGPSGSSAAAPRALQRRPAPRALFED